MLPPPRTRCQGDPACSNLPRGRKQIMNSTLDWVDEPHRFKILYEGRLLTAYNKGNPQYGDFFKAFPNIEPVHTLSGLPVTTSGAANFNHHKSIFLGLGRLNGHNFYHDCYPPFALYRPFPSGDIVQVDAKVRTEGGAVMLETRNEWVPKGGRAGAAAGILRAGRGHRRQRAGAHMHGTTEPYASPWQAAATPSTSTRSSRPPTASSTSDRTVTATSASASPMRWTRRTEGWSPTPPGARGATPSTNRWPTGSTTQAPSASTRWASRSCLARCIFWLSTVYSLAQSPDYATFMGLLFHYGPLFHHTVISS